MAGTLTISTLSDGTNSTSATNLVKAPCVAWVNFNGTGTVAIRASYNVSSITDLGTGLYTVNFTNAMPDTNYAVYVCGRPTNDAATYPYIAPTVIGGVYSTTAVTARTAASNPSIAAYDCDIMTVGVFR